METFGKYRLQRRIGVGGMAEVYLAREPLTGGLHKVLVIKKIHPQLAETPQFRQMFEDEAKVGMNLNHPNVVQTFSYGQIDGVFYLAMEHVEGVDLLTLLNGALARGERIPFGLSAYLGQQVAKGLDYAHRRTDEYGEHVGIVHRDISPQNILVSWDGMVKIVDFGIARARHVKESEGVVKGKFAYMSPEQASGEPVDARSDIFSMGIVLWELATSRSLFGTLKGKHALQAIRAGQFQRPREIDPRIPLGLEDIILRCLAVRADDRYQTSRDLHRALGKFFFELSAKEGQIFESGAMAAFMARVVSRETLLGDNAVTQRRPLVTPPPAGLDGLDGDAQRPRLSTDPALLSTARPIVVIEGELSGVSALRRSVGESRAREVLLDFLRVTENVAYKHGAHAERVDERGFAYVVGLGGGSEEDATSAIRLSLALIEALDGISRDVQPPLRIAIGIQRGSALVASAGPTADARVSAARSHHAGRAPTLARSDARRDPRRRRRLSRDARRVQLRGDRIDRSAEHQIAGRRHGRRARAQPGGARSRLSIDGPATSRRTPCRARVATRHIIGRERELEVLSQAFRATIADHTARNVILLGEAGVGKRTIVDAFRRLLPADARVLRVGARQSQRETPYSLIADLARDALGIDEGAEPREVKRGIEQAIALMFDPEEGREARQAAEAFGLLLGVKVHGAEEIDPGERRHRLYNAMRKVQRRLAQRVPLVLVVEDLQWADGQSFELFQSILREPLDRPYLSIATARLDERIEAQVLPHGSTTLYVSELGPRDRQALVESRLARPAEVQALTREILDRAGGNPFFIHELIESLVERGVLEPDPDAHERLLWTRRDEALSVPTTVEAVVASRLDRLPPAELETLRRAAVLGRVVPRRRRRGAVRRRARRAPIERRDGARAPVRTRHPRA